MKIAILTLPVQINYGGILQAFALQTALERKGHQVEILMNQDYYKLKWKNPWFYLKRLFDKWAGRPHVHMFYEKRRASRLKRKGEETEKFVHKYLNLRTIYSFSEINPEDYDAIVVGSDQVWRKRYFPKMWDAPMKEAFLDFAKDWPIKKISYAASFGLDNVNEYSEEDIRDCRAVAGLFDAISVREESGINICKEQFGVEAVHVPDPTMLLDKEDYIRLVEARDLPKNDGDMFCYMVLQTPFKKQTVNRIAEEKKLKPFYVGYHKPDSKLTAKKADMIQPPVESWIKGIMDAKLVVTDSFHATVFSLLFGKPFIVICKEGADRARFTSLLSWFGLEDRVISESSPALPEILENQSIEIPLAKLRETASAFLDENLKVAAK